ncbi:monovalent cation/H+ antiporter complex subunit F [Fodinicola acaciae]|uniref:monovalent cation/H+ antiporter complex subunit F n=1 Tax=Fodinicola acaciae TaxID=2681555 RepID=UPI001FE94E75|nr:monovalent cation/H+ antiporter complex subunit F [Fodinicola acaciae]
MNGWLVAAAILMVATMAALWLACTGSATQRVVGLQLSSCLLVLALLLLAQGFQQPPYLIVPLTLAVLSFAGTLVFNRLLRSR